MDQRRDEWSDATEVARLREALRVAEEHARRTDDLLPTLRRFADALAHATEPRDIIVEAVRAAVELLAPQGGLSAGVVEYEPGRGALKFRVYIKDGVELSLEDPFLAREGTVDDPGMVRPWQRIVTESFIWGLTSDETVLHPDYRSWHEAGGAVAVAYVPLRRGERVVGFVGFSLSGPTAPSSEQSELIQALATQVSLALEMLRISDIAREAAVARERELAAEERVRTLESTNAALTAAVTKIADVPVGRAPELLLVEVARAAGADVCYWLEYEPRAKTLEVTLRVKDGRLLDGPASDEPAIFGGPFSSELTPAFEMLRTQNAFTTVCSRSETPLMWPGAMEWHRRNGRREALAFAVQIGDMILGLVGMAFVNERALDDLVKQQLVRAIVNQFALGLRLSHLAEEAEARAVSEERNRMAGEIHDSLAQSFTSIALQSESLLSKLEPNSPLATTLGIIERTARHGLAEARASVLALRPTSDSVGELEAALAQLAERCNISGKVACEFRTSTEIGALSPDVRDTVLRVAQEAVNNALRHSRASRIFVDFDVHGGEARLTVSDDGVGMTGTAHLSGGFGIPGMRARAESLGGTLTVSPGTGAEGTAVRLRVACLAAPTRTT